MGPLARPDHIIIRDRRGPCDYRQTWDAMRAFTDGRGEGQADELWLLEHAPVYTLGQAGRPAHLHDPAGIPVIQSDRGGQVTYHGPGQLIAYVLVDLRRASIGVKGLVRLLEQAVIDLLATYGVDALARADAPGVYVDGAKIASLGLRVRNGCSYHGLALNVAMDLSPFARIDPCGYPGLTVTQMADLIPKLDPAAVRVGLGEALADALGLSARWVA